MRRKIALSLACAIVLASAASGPRAPSEAGDQLSAADMNAFPFPPGEHAALVKETCTECHSANLVTERTFDRASAERYYKLMVSNDADTEVARNVIEYLSTVLSDD
jgi:hypothetical protein